MKDQTLLNEPTTELILVVDDSPTNLSVLSQALKGAGFTVAVETDGEGAIEQSIYNPPDLILLDVMMPGINGFETCQKLKENPLTEEIPIIFMTALADSVDKVKGLSIGAVDYITKPFQQEEVLARVQTHLQIRNLTKKLEKQNQQLTTEIAQRLQTEAELKMTLQELQKTQKQMIIQEKLASLGALTAGIAHELKNPLNFINNFSIIVKDLNQELITKIMPKIQNFSELEVIEIEEIIENLEDSLDAIYEQGKKADNIIHSMLIHARQEDTQWELTDINTLLANAIKFTIKSSGTTSGQLEIELETHYDLTIEPLPVIPSSLNRAFINLINNSCYALNNKKKELLTQFHPQLIIQTQNLEKAIEIRIRDNGNGMTSEVVEKLFEPFFTTKPPGEGTGLGLSITNEIITGQHQGEIKVKTEVGIYSEFVILLPKNITVEVEDVCINN
jgi:two-component system, NtrC family, sensor kinase